MLPPCPSGDPRSHGSNSFLKLFKPQISRFCSGVTNTHQKVVMIKFVNDYKASGTYQVSASVSPLLPPSSS